MPGKTAIETKDERTLAIENNPCNMCKSMGKTTCSGHLSEGGGEETEGKTEGSEISGQSMPTPAPESKKSVEEVLLENEGWSQDFDNEGVLTFNSPYALFSMELSLDTGSIKIFGDEGLSPEKQKTLAVYMQAIADEVNEFKKSLDPSDPLVDKITVTCENNVMTITLPTPAYYDAFIERLIEKNLLPVAIKQAVLEHKEKNEAKADNSLSEEESPEELEEEKQTTPTPFDIHSGPKPKGFDIAS